jgi:hypothetical protein
MENIKIYATPTRPAAAMCEQQSAKLAIGKNNEEVCGMNKSV